MTVEYLDVSGAELKWKLVVPLPRYDSLHLLSSSVVFSVGGAPTRALLALGTRHGSKGSLLPLCRNEVSQK